jgi:hypothetical protein
VNRLCLAIMIGNNAHLSLISPNPALDSSILIVPPSEFVDADGEVEGYPY